MAAVSPETIASLLRLQPGGPGLVVQASDDRRGAIPEAHAATGLLHVLRKTMSRSPATNTKSAGSSVAIRGEKSKTSG